MNKTLKFSWGHIIAFIAMIVLCYLTFMGATYYAGGNIVAGVIAMVIVGLLAFVYFIALQVVKASDRHFERRIVIERVMVALSVPVLLLLALPMLHFSAVYARGDKLSSDFSAAVNGSRQLFTDYSTYAQERIDRYSAGLDAIIAAGPGNVRFATAGFRSGEMARIQRDNMVRALQLQLLPEDFDRLSADANKWIDEACDGADVWNIFLMGNTREVRAALAGWDGQLIEMAAHRMANEEYVTGKVDNFASAGVSGALTGLDSVNADFTRIGWPSWLALLVLVLLYAMLMLPYILQPRNTKARVSLKSQTPATDAWARNTEVKETPATAAKTGNDTAPKSRYKSF